MAQRKTAAEKKAEAEATAAAEAAVPVEAAPPETPPAVGVFVTKEIGPDGNLIVNVAPLGVEVTEVQTLLEIGLKTFRQQIGLGQGRG